MPLLPGGISTGEIMGRFGLGSLTGGSIFFVLKVVLAVGVLSALGWLASRFMSYNIEVRKLLLRGENVIEVTDMAKKFKTKSGFKCLKLLYAKVKLPIPSPNYFSLGSKRSFFGLINRPVQIVNYIQFGEYDFALLSQRVSDKIKQIKVKIKEDKIKKNEQGKLWKEVDELYTEELAEKIVPLSSKHIKNFLFKLKFEAIPQDVFGTAVQEVRLAPQRFQRKVPWMQIYGWHIAGFMILMFLLIAIWIITKNWGAAMNAGVSNIQKIAATGGAPGGV